MNKLISLLITILFLLGCKNNSTILKTALTEQPIFITYSEKLDRIYIMKIPIELGLKNKSINFKSFITIDCEYNPYSKGVGGEIYLKNDSVYKIKNNKKKTIQSFSEKTYIVYLRYRIDRFDSTNRYQENFKPYIKKMLAENKDTLHIGTVAEFKKKHKELFEKLTKNDSISIQFLNGKKLGERITVPVEF